MEPWASSQEMQRKEANHSESDEKEKHVNEEKGWISAILILGTSLGVTIASGAWYSNLLVFLIAKFNVKNIPAAQISNIFSGLINFFPLVAAILADSAFGNFTVILTSSIVSLLGVIIFTIIVTVKSLRPPSCTTKFTTCVSPTTFQYSILYIALVLGSIGLGGTRFLLGTIGADQFDKPKQQASFFNWFVVLLYFGLVISYTVVIYIQTNVSWALSFGIALAANITSVILFLAGSRMYRKFPPQGSPFTSIARVLIAALRNRKLDEPIDGEVHCHLYESEDSKLTHGPPSKSLRFLNRAALRRRDGNQGRGAETKSWSLCTVEEVEDLKKLIKLLPLWTSSLLLSGLIGVILSFTVLTALVMDRHVGSHFEIPAGSFTVTGAIFTATTSFLLDRLIYPAYKRFFGCRFTYLQGIGLGHVCNILASIAFALVERKRLNLVRTHHLMDQPHAVAPLSALWLVFPLAAIGIGEGFSFSPEVSLYYQEFPKPLRSTSTAMISLHIAVGYYVSSAFIAIIGRTTSWLPNDINYGRVDNACWVLAVIAFINYGYFLLCAMLYKYNNPDSALEDAKSVSH